MVVLVVGARPSGQASGGARQQQHHVGRAAPAWSAGRAGDGDQRQAEPAGMRDQVGQFGRLAAVGQRQHGVAGHDHAEVAVRRLGRMHEHAPGCRWRRRWRRSCAPTWPDLPMPETTTRPLQRGQQLDRLGEPLVERGRQRAQPGRLGRQDSLGDAHIGRHGRWRARRSSASLYGQAPAGGSTNPGNQVSRPVVHAATRSRN